MENEIFSNSEKKTTDSIIKVIGVGGGGSNAVNYMYLQNVKGVDFVVCNTDEQALEISPVPNKIRLGTTLTEGRGAGSLPEVGRNAAIENIQDVKDILGKNTKMAFITAGMGGGTGTGGAPVIAAAAKELGILTVGIVTVPFNFEGKKRKTQAEFGIEEFKQNVDTLIVICNDKLREIHGNLKLTEAFGYADNVVTTAAKGISDIITNALHINTDFADINTVLKDSGVAIMGSAQSSGENRAMRAIELALNSPLLNDNNIVGARYVLLNITCGTSEITMDELGEINDYVQEAAGQTAEIIQGYGIDETLGDDVKVTIIATGFKNLDGTPKNSVIQQEPAIKKMDVNKGIYEAFSKPVDVVETKVEEKVVAPEVSKIVYNLNDAVVNNVEIKAEEKIETVFEKEPVAQQNTFEFEVPQKETNFFTSRIETIVEEPQAPVVSTNVELNKEESKETLNDRFSKLRAFNFKIMKSAQGLSEMENIPAYKRREVDLAEVPHSSESFVSRFTLGENEDGKTELKLNNSFLHDNVD
jgi:cell division protein FtsZ